MESFSEAPLRSSFVSLSVHQSQTPSSFYSAPPVLYFSGTGRLLVRKEDAAHIPAIEIFAKDSQTNEDSWLVEEVEVWVSSEKFLLWRPSISTGLPIPYPSIALHAQGLIEEPGNPNVKARALYLMVMVVSEDENEGSEGAIALNFIPQSAHSESGDIESSEDTQLPVSQRLYDAITACADLHPDVDSQPSSNAGWEGEEDGDAERPAFDYEVHEGDGMPPPFPGSGGWITSENMHQFYDEEGNWRAGGLGPGAGLVRGRDEEDTPQVNGHSGEGDDDESTKWRRTD